MTTSESNNSSDTADQRFMRRALRLARLGFTAPNPMVGCVLVRNGEIVGQGYHPRAGEPHAEIFALTDAGERAQGATVYVTLEPCAHWGRTPPCTDALIAAGVRRVVAATKDANLSVPHGGMLKLAEAGIVTQLGVLEDAASELNEAYFHYQLTGRPFVTLKWAMSLDGKSATRTGSSQWITSKRARKIVHEMRARSGAVLTGIGTLLADDAELTSRLEPAPPRQPLRVVLDSRLRTPPECRAVRAIRPDTPLLIFASHDAPVGAEEALTRAGAQVTRVGRDAHGALDLSAVLADLGAREIVSLFVEGGGAINASFVERGEAQKALAFIAPLLIGGKDASTPVEGRGAGVIDEAVQLHRMLVRRVGPDVLLEGYLQTTTQRDRRA